MENGPSRVLRKGKGSKGSGLGGYGLRHKQLQSGGTGEVGAGVPSAAAPPLAGYMRIQQFRKTDGSYGAWLHRDSSTW